ncbi:hypothetical protein PTKIN_Ptkin09bG0239100 [Pterospermum kingtungense]
MARNWPEPSTHKYFQVKSLGAQFTVDLQEKECCCRRWQLCGIPCPHACAAIAYNQEHPEDYVHSCYHVEIQRLIYKEAIPPIAGEKQWPDSEFKPKPPRGSRKQPSRPKTKRRKEPDEQNRNTRKLPKTGVTITCSKCGKTGHNIRSCKRKGSATREGSISSFVNAGISGQSTSEVVSQQSSIPEMIVRWMPDGSSQTFFPNSTPHAAQNTNAGSQSQQAPTAPSVSKKAKGKHVPSRYMNPIAAKKNDAKKNGGTNVFGKAKKK